MKYYSIRVDEDGKIPIDDLRVRPVDQIMKTPDGHALYMQGIWQYPKDRFIYLRYIEAWEYDMLLAFGIPDVSDILMKGLDDEYLLWAQSNNV